MISKKLNEMKDAADLTNQEVSDMSGVPLGTVNRIFSGQTDNPSFQNIAAIVRALGGSLDDLAGLPNKSHTENHHVSDKLIDLYREQIAGKNKWIKTLFACLITLVGIIVFMLLWDITHPNMGYVRY